MVGGLDCLTVKRAVQEATPHGCRRSGWQPPGRSPAANLGVNLHGSTVAETLTPVPDQP